MPSGEPNFNGYVVESLSSPQFWLALMVSCLLMGFMVYPSLLMFAEAQHQHIRRLHENGSPPAQVMWLVLTQGLVLAVLGAGLGIVVGVAGSWAIIEAIQDPRLGLWNVAMVVPWWPPTVMLVTVLVSCTVAALLVSRRSGSKQRFAPTTGFRRFVPSLVAAGLCSLTGAAAVYVVVSPHESAMDKWSVMWPVLATTVTAPFVCLTVAWWMLVTVTRWRWWLARFAARMVQRRVAPLAMTALAVAALSMLAIPLAFVVRPEAEISGSSPRAYSDAQVYLTGSEAGALTGAEWEAKLAAVAKVLPHTTVRPEVSPASIPANQTGRIGVLANNEQPPPADTSLAEWTRQVDSRQDDHGNYYGANSAIAHAYYVVQPPEAQRIFNLTNEQVAAYQNGTVLHILPPHWPEARASDTMYLGVGEGSANEHRSIESHSGMRWEQVPMLRPQPRVPVNNEYMLVPPTLMEEFQLPTETTGGYVTSPFGVTEADKRAVEVETDNTTLSIPASPDGWLTTIPLAIVTVAAATLLTFSMMMLRRQMRQDLVAVTALGSSRRGARWVMGFMTVLVGVAGTSIGIMLPVLAVSGALFSDPSILLDIVPAQERLNSKTWLTLLSYGKWMVVSFAVFVLLPSLIAGWLVAVTTRVPQVSARSG